LVYSETTKKKEFILEKYQEKVAYYLNEFQKYEKNYGNGIPYSITINKGKHSGHIIFSSLVHGNEVGSLPGILKCIDDIISNKIKFFGKVSFFLGNIEACLKNLRFVESDLNRSFGENYKGALSKERKRALEIMPLLKQADVYFDFHQTIMPCLKPFYIFEMNKQSYYWARAAGVANTLVTRKKGISFSSAGMCTDEFVRSLHKAGITIELGEKGFHKESEIMSYEIMKRSLKCLDKVFLKHSSIIKLSRKNIDFEFLNIVYREPFHHAKMQLNEGIINFKSITTETKLGVNQFGKDIFSKYSGYILFPKYPKRSENGEAIPPLPGEIFVVADKIKEHPLVWKE
jgi:succinylglutamate desuccinylase